MDGMGEKPPPMRPKRPSADTWARTDKSPSHADPLSKGRQPWADAGQVSPGYPKGVSDQEKAPSGLDEI